jgi:hypothetical protein
MIPSIGRIVHLKLTDAQALSINKRRADARASAIGSTNSGAIVHAGNAAHEGDVYPLLITRVWADEPTEDSGVNGQVFLDGNDSLWVTSAVQGVGPGQWHQPARVAY